jgi:hypothetical protein
MTPLAYEVRWLKGAFHRVLLRLVDPGARIRPPVLFEARAIGRWLWLVKQCWGDFGGFSRRNDAVTHRRLSVIETSRGNECTAAKGIL